jgi:hypothetical protein
VNATTTAAVAFVDVISHSLDGKDRDGGGARGRRLSLARVNDGAGGARGHWLLLRDGENNFALAALLALSREDDGNADDGTRRWCTTMRTAAELTRHCSPSRDRRERQWRGGLRCLGSIVGRLLLACWTAARAAEHTMALACLIDGDDAGEAEDSV